jgi:hypothetical protein
MPRTRNDLAIATLEELQIVGPDEPAAASDLNTVLGVMDSVFADLVARNVIFWGIGSDIDDAQFEHLACVLAKRIAPRFSRGSDAVVAANAADAEDKLRTIARINRGTRRNLRVDNGLMIQRRRSYFRIGD